MEVSSAMSHSWIHSGSAVSASPDTCRPAVLGNCSLMQVWECSVSLLIYLLCSPRSQADQAVQRLNYLESDFSHRIISRFAAPICSVTVLLKSFCWTQAIAGPSWENRDTNIYVPAAGKSFCHPSKSCPVFSYFHNIAIPKIIDSCLLEVWGVSPLESHESFPNTNINLSLS